MTTPSRTPTVFLACPTRADVRAHALAVAAACRPVNPDRTGLGPVRVGDPVFAASSLLTFNFNNLWAIALNARATDGVTHFAMLHDDVCPGPYWLDTLFAEMARLDADVVSCVIPFKDDSGLTSTAVETGDPWNPRRLTLYEAHLLPETFGDADAGGELLLNTGCWLARIDTDWAERVSFRQRDSILYRDGQYHARTAPEDWNFSRAVRAATLAVDGEGRDARLFATRKVQLFHEHARCTNAYPWGRFQIDPAHAQGGRATAPEAA